MLIEVTSVAASAVGTDLLQGSVHRQSGVDRVITGFGLFSAGNTASGVRGDLFVGDVLVANGRAVGTVGNVGGNALFPVAAVVPAGAEIRFIVSTADSSNFAHVIVEVDELGR